MSGKAKESDSSLQEEAKRSLKFEAAPSDNSLITSSIRKKKRGELKLSTPASEIPRINLRKAHLRPHLRTQRYW
jgi:hypothetical protein